MSESPRDQARTAPLESGVYLMHDESGKIIYIGKAKSLRKRLLSYFSGAKDIKTATLVKHISSIETIIVHNEYEALLLENTLIKQHSPKYNINLKDGKTYPVIKVTNEAFPRIYRTRRVIEDGAHYYGPYPKVSAIEDLLELVNRLFPLRKCRKMGKRTAPCMYWHIGRCSAPCVGKISKEDYAKEVAKVEALLSGETDSLLAGLREDMTAAAGAMNFERAAYLRDTIRGIETMGAENAVIDFDPEARDYITKAEEGILVTFTVFSMRAGRMTGRELFRARSAGDEEETLLSFMTSYYSPDRPPPPAIYLDAKQVPRRELKAWFKGHFKLMVNLPKADERRHQVVLALARQNAEEDLRARLKERGMGPVLVELADALKLERAPSLIEGFDIAQLDGRHPVASLISFENGRPDRKNYRHYKLRTVEGIVDDFQAMREAVTRRYSKRLEEGAELPDLILIDGGIGQVNAAAGVLAGLGIHTDIVGLAKRDEELWLPGAAEPIRLSKDSSALKLLQHVRDETHRFATGLNQRLRSKDLALKALEAIPGIGKARAARLMKGAGSLTALAAMNAEELSRAFKLSPAIAAAIPPAVQEALAAQKARRLALSRKETGGRQGTSGSTQPGRLTSPRFGGPGAGKAHYQQNSSISPYGDSDHTDASRASFAAESIADLAREALANAAARSESGDASSDGEGDAEEL